MPHLIREDSRDSLFIHLLAATGRAMALRENKSRGSERLPRAYFAFPTINSSTAFKSFGALGKWPAPAFTITVIFPPSSLYFFSALSVNSLKNGSRLPQSCKIGTPALASGAKSNGLFFSRVDFKMGFSAKMQETLSGFSSAQP